jgi:hypothetical protein
MGGAVRQVTQAVTKPIQKAAEQVGIIKERPAAAQSPLAEMAKAATSASGAPAPAAAAAGASAAGTAAAAQKEEILARRRARRGGRALLSEARLNPEQGVGQQTLGSTGMS